MNPPSRPATIAELAERARENVNNWDDHSTLKHLLRLAEKDRRSGADFFERYGCYSKPEHWFSCMLSRKDLENSFIAFARAASMILEKIPTHREYHSTLSKTQRTNLALVGHFPRIKKPYILGGPL